MKLKLVMRKRIFGEVDMPEDVADLLDANGEPICSIYPTVKEGGLQIACATDLLDFDNLMAFEIELPNKDKVRNIWIPLKTVKDGGV